MTRETIVGRFACLVLFTVSLRRRTTKIRQTMRLRGISAPSNVASRFADIHRLKAAMRIPEPEELFAGLALDCAIGVVADKG